MVLMHVPFSNEIQLILALPVMIFFGGSFPSRAMLSMLGVLMYGCP